MKVNKNSCTKEAMGIVKDLTVKGQDFPTIISVEYQVENITYVVTESIKLKSEKIKVGFLPVGQKKVPVMGDIRIGRPAMVKYNPDDPKEAYIRDNIGKSNI